MCVRRAGALVGLLVIATMAMGVAETALVGLLLSTALLIGLAASATYLVTRGPGHCRSRGTRRRGDVGGHRAGLRQLLLDVADEWEGLAGQLLHYRADARHLSTGRTGP